MNSVGKYLKRNMSHSLPSLFSSVLMTHRRVHWNKPVSNQCQVTSHISSRRHDTNCASLSLQAIVVVVVVVVVVDRFQKHHFRFL